MAEEKKNFFSSHVFEKKHRHKTKKHKKQTQNSKFLFHEQYSNSASRFYFEFFGKSESIFVFTMYQ